MRVFLDANILFSAGKSAGAMRGFLEVLKSSGQTLVADAYVVEEARRNLEAKFPGSLQDFEGLLNQIEFSATLRCSLPPGIASEMPEKDRPVLAAAIQRRCDVLLTGDKTHFGLFYGKSLECVTIHAPASLAKQMGGESTDSASVSS